MTSDNEEIVDLVEVSVNGLALDVTTNSPVVMLGPADSEKVLPIWIGHYEAWAIAMELSGMPSKRPMTHDLLRKIIEDLKAKVIRVEVFDLKEQTFYARVVLRSNGNELVFDARPSDSIALALKAKAPIFANPKLFDLKQPPVGGKQAIDPQELKDRLKKINPEDFGKYSL